MIPVKNRYTSEIIGEFEIAPGANLSGADLRGANLRGVNLMWADLSGAFGSFSQFSAGRHTAIAAGGYISIGCEYQTYDEWLRRYAEIGAENGYTPEEVKRYGAWIKLVVPWLEEQKCTQ